MVDLYEQEYDQIYATVQAVQQKYLGLVNSGENLERLHRELEGRLNDLGFGVVLDVTSQPISLSITERLDNKAFDAERKRWEVKKRLTEKRATPVDQIEGAV